MRLRIDAEEKKLDNLLDQIRKVDNDELQAHLSKYFCIKISGYLENVLKSLVEAYSTGTCPKPIKTYIDGSVKSITNLSEDKLCTFLKKFDPDWESRFLSTISERELQSLNSIISNRNNISHGQQDNISYTYVSQYYSDLKGVIKVLRDIVKK